MMGYFEVFKYYVYEEFVIVQKKVFIVLSERVKCDILYKI